MCPLQLTSRRESLKRAPVLRAADCSGPRSLVLAVCPPRPCGRGLRVRSGPGRLWSSPRRSGVRAHGAALTASVLSAGRRRRAAGRKKAQRRPSLRSKGSGTRSRRRQGRAKKRKARTPKVAVTRPARVRGAGWTWAETGCFPGSLGAWRPEGRCERPETQGLGQATSWSWRLAGCHLRHGSRRRESRGRCQRGSRGRGGRGEGWTRGPFLKCFLLTLGPGPEV